MFPAFSCFCVRVEELLTLRQVGQQQAGLYQCLAHNDVASVVTAGARLRITASSQHSQSQQQQPLNPAHGQSLCHLRYDLFSRRG